MTGTDKRKRVILHCGAPKTGSTSLQFFFAHQEAALRADGAVCPGRFVSADRVDPIHTHLLAMRKSRTRDEGIRAARARLEELFAEAGVHTILVSNESMFGEPFMEGERAFFPRFDMATDAVREMTAGYEVHLIYFIRDFAGFVPSYYVQHVRKGSTLTFAEYCAAFDQADLRWLPKVEKLRAVFGEDAVTVFDHAALSRDPAATFAASFGRFFPSLPPFEGGSYGHNRSVGPGLLAFYRVMNRLFDAFVPAGSRRSARRKMRRYLFGPAERIAGSGRFTAPMHITAAWAPFYEADRRALFDGQPNTNGNSE